MNQVQLIEKQGEVVRLQSEIIDELFLLLMEHMAVDDIGEDCINKIKRAALKQKEII